MSSILTNNSAMTALQTLKGINSNLQETQSQISTGKAVGSAKDNSAVWAISKVMESDVKGFQAISKSLALGDSTIAVARNGSERVSDLLTDIKGKIVDAQEENVDRSKIQTDIDALTDQIKSVVGAAQFNGLNLLQGTEDVNILSALNRSSDGGVEAKNITVARADLSTDAGRYSTTGTDLSANAVVADAATAVESAGNVATITVATAGAGSVTLNGAVVDYAFDTDATTTADALAGKINALGLEGLTAVNNAGAVEISSARAFEDVSVTAAGTGASSDVTEIAQRSERVDFNVAANVNEGDGYKVTIGGASYDYIAGKGEDMGDVARGLKVAIDSAGIEGVTTRVTQNETTGQFSLKVDNDGTGSASLAFASAGLSGGEASGGLFGLDNIDVTATDSATAALDTIETLINTAIDASADFGSAQGRIENQAEFIDSLTDSLKSGIGSLVDADLEEASARLQALQVQQQLGVQALSIANQAPQSLLSLFR